MNSIFEYRKVSPSELKSVRVGMKISEIDIQAVGDEVFSDGWEIIGIFSDCFFLKRLAKNNQ